MDLPCCIRGCCCIPVHWTFGAVCLHCRALFVQVTPDLLQRLGSMISDSERPNSTLARLKGLFTFASFMWVQCLET